MPDLNTLPSDLPRPVDDGACAHLIGMTMPEITLASTQGPAVNVAALPPGRTVIYCYPRTGIPGEALPQGWDETPGARGCTPQACAFRDHHRELEARGAHVFGLSTQSTDYQLEMAERLHLPFPVLSDSDLRLARALRLPTFEVAGMTMIKRLTLIVRDGVIEHVFYPVFPPDESATEVMRWLAARPKRAHRR
jgi:peroxiredoxin